MASNNHAWKRNHLKEYCWKKKESIENPKKEENQVESSMIDEVLSAKLGMVDKCLPVCNVSHHYENWLLDSGASHHMIPHRNWSTSYQVVNGSFVFMGNNISCRTIKIYDDTVGTLIDVT